MHDIEIRTQFPSSENKARQIANIFQNIAFFGLYKIKHMAILSGSWHKA